MSKRRTPSPEFQAKVAMEAISCRKTLQQIGRLQMELEWLKKSQQVWATEITTMPLRKGFL